MWLEFSRIPFNPARKGFAWTCLVRARSAEETGDGARRPKQSRAKKAKAARFTDKFIRGLPLPPPGRKDYVRYDSEVRGLSIRVTTGGGKIFNYKHGAGPRIPIGPYPTWTVEKARTHARSLIGKIADGENVVGEHRNKQIRKRAIGRGDITTLADAFDAYAKTNPGEAKPEYFRLAQPILKRVFGTLLNLPLDEVTGDMLKHALRAYHAKPYAHRAETCLRALLNWSSDEYKIPNPLSRKRIIPQVPSRKVFLTAEQMQQEVFPAAKTLGWPGGPLLQWLMGLGVRRNEAAGARWSEFNANRTEWIIPATRMKGGERRAEPLWIPLPWQYTVMLNSFPSFKDSEYVFTVNGRNPANTQFSAYRRKLDVALKGSGVPDNFRVHDFRRTLTTWASKAGYKREVAQVALGHKAFASIEGVYNVYEYYDERREMFQRWADVLFGSEAKLDAKPSVPAVRKDPPLEGTVIPKAQPELFGPARTDPPPAAAIMPEPVQIASLEDAYWLLLGCVCHSKAVLDAMSRLWNVPESGFLKAFRDQAVLNRETPARSALHAVLTSAVHAALLHIRVFTLREIEETRERLGRELVVALGREERYRAEAAQAWEIGDEDSVRKAEAESAAAAGEAAKLQRQIDDLPGPNHPLTIKYAKGLKAAITEGIQKSLYVLLTQILTRPKEHKGLVTAVANAVKDGVASRFTLREDRWAWQAE
jgi:integrase